MNEEASSSTPFLSILLIILIEGFVTIAVEMLTLRQLITVAGNSVIITSLIVGVFLLFLAFGYYRGGKYRVDYRRVLVTNFTGSALLLGVGLSYPFVQISFFLLYKFVAVHALVALTGYLLLITAPLVYLLGQTVPITAYLLQKKSADADYVGSTSGKVLCLSTLGSFLGSIITTLVLMNFLGVAWTICVNFGLLTLLIIMLADVKVEFRRLCLLLLAGAGVYWLNVVIERSIFIKTNNFGDYQVISPTHFAGEVGRLLSINHAASSFLTPDKKGFAYIEAIKKILFVDLGLTHKDILVLGAGGFTLSAQSAYGNQFLYVDIDAALPSIVKKGFIDQIKGQFIAQDARKFLLHTTKRFDVVVSDVYSCRYTIPFHLLTEEYCEAIQHVLNPSGLVIFNIIANPTLRDNYSKRVDNTLRGVFKNCMSLPLSYHDGPENIIYICTARPNADTTVYTDNKNSSMVDIFHNNEYNG